MLATESILRQSSEEVLAEHGQSFYFASLVFSKEQRQRVAELYSFCRYVDDCADELKHDESVLALQQLQKELQEPPGSQTRLQKRISDLEANGVTREHMNELLKGALFDVQKEQVLYDGDLALYCYRVAGVVGLMMCPLLGVQDKQAYPYAIDLGLAMQLTNICRDVQEDAQNQRRYLPLEGLEFSDLDTLDFVEKKAAPEALKHRVRRYLNIADLFYESGYKGLAYIPLRPRLCILIAGEVYRSIGRKIRQKNYEVLRGRVYLTRWEKVAVVFRSLPRLLRKSFWVKCGDHENEWHQHLAGLPGVAEESRVVS